MRDKLNPGRLRNLTQAGVYGDGGGLYLQVRDAEHRSWIYRYTLYGKARWMGLGAFADVSLSEARQLAEATRKLVRQGVDPIDHRQAEETAKRAAARLNSFEEVADAYIKAHEASWRNDKHKQQWRNTLATYAGPVMGKMPVAKVDVAAVSRVLEPIWREKPETASRLRGRIESVLDFAAARGWRTGENPARWRGHLENLFPARAKIAAVEHHAALPWQDVPAFLGELAAAKGIAALALRFLILTAARTGEVIGATWGEIDMTAKTWTIPAERMKARTEHRVPLSAGAVAILEAVKPFKRGDDKPVFPSPSVGSLSNMTLAAVMKRLKRAETVHGFRSSFRDWAAETTTWPREICEAALAHTIGGVEAAYRRGDLFDKRRQLMTEWAVYCGEEL